MEVIISNYLNTPREKTCRLFLSEDEAPRKTPCAIVPVLAVKTTFLGTWVRITFPFTVSLPSTMFISEMTVIFNDPKAERPLIPVSNQILELESSLSPA